MRGDELLEVGHQPLNRQRPPKGSLASIRRATAESSYQVPDANNRPSAARVNRHGG
jgi:hypothetical protein